MVVCVVVRPRLFESARLARPGLVSMCVLPCVPLVFVICLRECFFCVWLSARESVRLARPVPCESVFLARPRAFVMILRGYMCCITTPSF